MRRRTLLSAAATLPALVATPTLPPMGAWGTAAAQTGAGPAAAARQAIAYAQGQRWAEAEAAAQGADPLIRKYVAWLRLLSRQGGGSAAEVVGFALANPAWPGQDALQRRAEEALAADPDDRLAADWFAARAPRSLEGYQRIADALARAGRGEEAREMLRRGWAEAPGDALAEGTYLDRNAAALDAELHWRRFDRLSILREGVPARLVPLLEPRRQIIAQARLAYAAEAAEADSPALAAAARGDLGLAYERARWLRRRERDAEAAAAWEAGQAQQRNLLPEVARILWVERQILARKLLRLGEPRLAYAVAAQHGQALPGEPRQEAEFLAGFIALRRTEDAAAAERHFARIRDGSLSPITRARSHYWEGRAAAARGQRDRAREHYRAAAAYPVAFYGQLGALALGEDAATLAARIAAAGPQPDATQAGELDRQEMARLALLLGELGEGRRARTFLLRLVENAATPGEKLLVARLAQRTGRPENPIWVVRRGSTSGLMAPIEGYPTPYPTPAGVLEPALVNAIARQESNFDTEAVSSANARGVMQLLPSTAEMVARQLGIPHRTAMLTSDPAHNMQLGSAYLAGLLDRFGGVLPFAVAGYNAGPGRIGQWNAAQGDPRAEGGPTMLDWMELIPFAETRNYVQRVIENLVVYRARDPSTGAAEHPMARWLRDGGGA